MSFYQKTELELRHHFDPMSCRHYLNNHLTVLHCHHYASLYTQLAMDCSFLNAKKLLAECMEDAVYPMLTEYYREHCIDKIEDRIKMAEELYAAMGLGKMEVRFMGPYSGCVILKYSHVDQGWIKKWGPYSQPVNYITAGFIAATFSAVYDKSPRSYTVTENKSIVCGEAESEFAVVAQ